MTSALTAEERTLRLGSRLDDRANSRHHVARSNLLILVLLWRDHGLNSFKRSA